MWFNFSNTVGIGSPMFTATHVEMIRGTDVEARNKRYETPFHRAARKGHLTNQIHLWYKYIHIKNAVLARSPGPFLKYQSMKSWEDIWCTSGGRQGGEVLLEGAIRVHRFWKVGFSRGQLERIREIVFGAHLRRRRGEGECRRIHLFSFVLFFCFVFSFILFSFVFFCFVLFFFFFFFSFSFLFFSFLDQWESVSIRFDNCILNQTWQYMLH